MGRFVGQKSRFAAYFMWQIMDCGPVCVTLLCGLSVRGVWMKITFIFKKGLERLLTQFNPATQFDTGESQNVLFLAALCMTHIVLGGDFFIQPLTISTLLLCKKYKVRIIIFKRIFGINLAFVGLHIHSSTFTLKKEPSLLKFSEHFFIVNPP